MKKIYSLLALLMLLALPAMAQVNSLTDLYGKYRFTASLEIVDEAYASQLSADCDVEISATEVYSGKIVGFCGSQNAMNINDISTELKKIKVTNPNNPQLWNSIHLANAEGQYPYGIYDSTLGEWTLESYGPIYFDYDPATKEITVPDFTVVTCDHSVFAATVVARYTNVKMTLVETAVIEVADISGDWNFKAGSGTYDTMQGSLLPTEFAVSFAKTGDDNRNYKATVNVEGANEIVLDATFDGNMLTLPYDSVYLNDVLRLAPMYGPAKNGTIEFMSSSEDAFTLYSGFSIARDSIGKTKDELSDSTIVVYEQWYTAGTLKRPSSAPAFTWDGTFTVNVNSSDIILADGGVSGIEWPAEFQMVVQYYDVIDAYYVVEFLGFNVGNLNNGGIPLVVGADGTTASIELGDTFYGHSFLKSNGDVAFVALTNQNGLNGSINMTLGEDGTISIEPFFVQNFDYSALSYTMPIVFYQNAVATKYVEPESEPYDWSGTYALTSNVSGDGADSFPQSFYVKVTYQENYDVYLVTEFAGRDIAVINYGGLSLVPDKEGNSAEMATGNIAWQGEQGSSNMIKLRNGNGTTSNILLTMNEDGTISVADFVIMAGAPGEESANVLLASYSNVLLVKDGEIVAPEPPTESEEQYYRIYSTSQNKYLHIESYNANNAAGPKGAVGLSEYVSETVNPAESANQIFRIEEAENGLVYLVSANEYYIVCRQWNVDACNDGQKSALGMDYISDTEFRLLNGSQYFKVGEVDGMWGEYYPYCDAAISVAETWRLEPATVPVGIENVVSDGAVVKGIYDITGRKIETITAPGLYIVDGKKVLVK